MLKSTNTLSWKKWIRTWKLLVQKSVLTGKLFTFYFLTEFLYIKSELLKGDLRLYIRSKENQLGQFKIQRVFIFFVSSVVIFISVGRYIFINWLEDIIKYLHCGDLVPTYLQIDAKKVVLQMWEFFVPLITFSALEVEKRFFYKKWRFYIRDRKNMGCQKFRSLHKWQKGGNSTIEILKKCHFFEFGDVVWPWGVPSKTT